MACQGLCFLGVHPAGNHQINIRDTKRVKVELPGFGVFRNAGGLEILIKLPGRVARHIEQGVCGNRAGQLVFIDVPVPG